MIARLKPLLYHLAGLAVALLFVLPLFWALVASLRPPGLPPPTTIEWWPVDPRWRNYAEIFALVPLGRYLRNSLIVVEVAVPLTILTASLAGFGLSQLPDGLRRRLFWLSIILLMVPAMSIWMFRFYVLKQFGLVDTLWALIVPAFAAGSPLFVLLFYWTFWRVPGEIYESARLDGANALVIWWRIAQPLAWPTTAGVAVLAFVMYWNDFTSPVMYVYRPDLYTLPVGLAILKQMDATNWPLLMAAAVVMTLPVLLLFGVLQRHFLHALSLGSLLERN